MIELRNLSFQQGGFGLNNIGFKISEGQYAVLMGETGCGKTSLLEVIAGLKPVLKGQVLLQGREVTHWKPACRQIGYVPQEGSLFASMKVEDNIAFALEVRGWNRVDREQRAQELAEMMSIESLLKRSIHGLSGGERQRVALARALAFRPEVLLMDEPLSALDEKTRETLCELLKRIQVETKVTVLHVTHNPWEAERLADVTLHMSEGQVREGESF